MIGDWQSELVVHSDTIPDVFTRKATDTHDLRRLQSRNRSPTDEV